ncbi:MAG: ceramidase [Gammaproteobacteria bacterium]|nr:ceramidase [Gammaproteobacteria bacterium]
MEIMNQVSNLAFIIGAIYTWLYWKQRGSNDKFSLTLIILVALIGLGSFTFHTYPSSTTIWIDLIPIQIFGLSYFAYIGLRYFEASKIKIIIALITFFYIRQYWIIVMPRGALGGGITHIPTLFLLITCSLFLLSKHKKFSAMLLSAACIYVLALFVRAYDEQISLVFSLGLHWIWHILTAITASILIYATVKFPSNYNNLNA